MLFGKDNDGLDFCFCRVTRQRVVVLLVRNLREGSHVLIVVDNKAATLIVHMAGCAPGWTKSCSPRSELAVPGICNRRTKHAERIFQGHSQRRTTTEF